MSQISSMLGNLPGMGTVVETYEAAIFWGNVYQQKWWNGWIDANAVDVGNTGTTWKLRPGLVLGQIAASGRWTNYSPTATDGSQVARAVLPIGLRMQDVLSGLTTQKFYAILIGGNLKGANLLGLDQNARNQLGDWFQFDDQLNTMTPVAEWLFFQTRTANYQIVALTDNQCLFDNLGATGEVDFTLPPITNGQKYGFQVLASQTLKVISHEGGNVVGTTLTQSSVSANAIGAKFAVFSNPAGTKWLVENLSSGTQTLTYV